MNASAGRPDLLLFPKFEYLNQTPPWSVDALIDHAERCGFDGIEVMIRETSWCREEDLPRSLPAFVRAVRARGLKAYTATTDWQHEQIAQLDDAYRLFADEGIGKVRVTVQWYRGAGAWREDFERCRRSVALLEEAGRKYGVQALIQTHGAAMVFSPAIGYFLLDDIDPAAVGIHYDPGNMMHQEGWTDPPKALDLIGPHLGYVGMKSCGWFRVPDPTRGQRLTWRREWTRLEEGCIDWPLIIQELARVGYAGPVCTHHFYEHSMESLVEGVQADAAYARKLIDEAYGGQ